MKKLLFAISIAILSGISSHAQKQEVVDALEVNYQSCLLHSNEKISCAEKFFFQMDSMLTKVYNKLRAALNETEKQKLTSEQKKWLIEKDAFFKQTKEKMENRKPGQPANEPVIVSDTAVTEMYDENARFVKERLFELMKRLNK